MVGIGPFPEGRHPHFPGEEGWDGSCPGTGGLVRDKGALTCLGSLPAVPVSFVSGV